jgi:hypothetical protein
VGMDRNRTTFRIHTLMIITNDDPDWVKGLMYEMPSLWRPDRKVVLAFDTTNGEYLYYFVEWIHWR